MTKIEEPVDMRRVIARAQMVYRQPASREVASAAEDALMLENLEIIRRARERLGLPARPTPGIHKAPYPRFRTLCIHFRAAIFGYQSPETQHMVERNKMLDGIRQMQAVTG